ncbi:hypothetical protein C1701_16125 [Actinoalloteichus sp. AHMU CJ021]|uniref:Trypsin n=1 Tax=Actinoalloteichus caeruleus DSM 43889 TaxID=1120930 RepID=A0ABT1JMU8_ACTCY|nr:trypsin-like serine protease [Actinoalloteichus caeruleus]AUS79624.1 hypothetical protein C1701_16125 [Actinoalloteichus sp. AHMU CJ021]MCP2333843.1 Trypsin [Actinoalloteichus caeruleus DSM 43889]
MRPLRVVAAAACLAISGLVAPLAGAATAEPAELDTANQPMIIDGNFAEETRGAARLFRNGAEVCSATVIAPEWVLTAEHCVASSGNSVRYGDLDQHAGTLVDQAPNGVITHPSADLALIRLANEVDTEFTPLAPSQQVAVGDTVQTYGWGATCIPAPGQGEASCQSQYLKYANVEVTGVDGTCRGDYRGGLGVCGSRIDGIPAGGDSGGPMFAESGYQIGVASTSDRRSVTVYTHITPYRDWITQHTGV